MKFETRNSKLESNPKLEIAKSHGSPFRISSFGLASDFGFRHSDFHFAPVPARTTGTVRQRIFRSSQKDQLSIYSRSRRTQSRKSAPLLWPLVCHRQVWPGL